MRELLLSFDGKEYRCKTTYDVIMHIEDRVTLSGLGVRLAQGLENGQIPVSHICWLIYCLLKGGGCQASPDEILQGIKDGRLGQENQNAVVGFVLEEVFGVLPDMGDEEVEQEEGAEEDQPKKPQTEG